MAFGMTKKTDAYKYPSHSWSDDQTASGQILYGRILY